MKKGRITPIIKILGITFLCAGLVSIAFSLIIDAGIAGLIPSGIFVVAGGIMLIVVGAIDGKKRKLMETGEQAEGIITAVNLDYAVRVNNRHPFRAECKVTDPVIGAVYLYSSPRVTSDIRHLEGCAVTVYYDPNNRKNYYVDIEAAIEKAAENGAEVYDYR